MSDKSRHLTPTKRHLLEHLVRNAGRVVSHNQLLDPSIDNLRHCIWRPHKKIEIDRALPRVITNHYGVGYSFAEKEEARWFPEEEGQ